MESTVGNNKSAQQFERALLGSPQMPDRYKIPNPQIDIKTKPQESLSTIPYKPKNNSYWTWIVGSIIAGLIYVAWKSKKSEGFLSANPAKDEKPLEANANKAGLIQPTATDLDNLENNKATQEAFYQ